MDSVEEESNATESPSRSRGDGGWGFHLRERRAITLSCAPFRTAGLGLSRGREADVWRADYAALLHLRFQIIRAQPSAGLCHVGDILQDHYVVRVLGVAEYSPIRDTRGGAVLFASIVSPTPCGVILDLEDKPEIIEERRKQRAGTLRLSAFSGRDHGSQHTMCSGTKTHPRR